MEGRQRLSDPDLLTHHPPHLTDSFTLHLKAQILAGRIIDFNGAIRIRRQSDYNNGASTLDAFFTPGGHAYSDNILFAATFGADHQPTPLSDDKTERARPIDSYSEPLLRLRDLPEFLALDTAIVSFQNSIPKEYQDPFYVKDSDSGYGHSSCSVDPHLYCAHALCWS
jgi:hypothetical protein